MIHDHCQRCLSEDYFRQTKRMATLPLLKGTHSMLTSHFENPRSGQTPRAGARLGPSRSFVIGVLSLCLGLCLSADTQAAPLQAGAAKVDITNREAGPVNDPLWVKALVIKSDSTTAVIVTVDAVAIGQIGHIKNDYLGKVRSRIEKELGIKHTTPWQWLAFTITFAGLMPSSCSIRERTFPR